MAHCPDPPGVGADLLAKLGRESHPNNHQPLPKRPRMQWGDVLGLEEMSSGSEGEAWDSRRPQDGDQSMCSGSSEAGGVQETESLFNTHVSDIRWNIRFT